MSESEVHVRPRNQRWEVVDAESGHVISTHARCDDAVVVAQFLAAREGKKVVAFDESGHRVQPPPEEPPAIHPN